MPRKKSLKTSGKQKVLALVFALTMVSGFAIVWATAQYYDSTNVVTQLYITDSDAEFTSVEVTDNYDHFPEGNVTSRQLNAVGVYHNETLWTPAYLGNNTWAVSVGDVPVSTYDNVAIQLTIDMPNIDNWIIDHIIINATAPAEAYGYSVNMFHLTEPYAVTSGGTGIDASQSTLLELNSVGTVDEFIENLTVSQAKALRIYDLTQATPENFLHIGFSITDPDTTGCDAFSWSFTIEVMGHLQTTTTLSSVLIWGLGATVILNLIVIVYMTDAVDMGGFVKDIKKRRS